MAASAKVGAENGASTAQRSTQMDTREFVETVVFVLVLVNLLRMFGAEAFVIPTGSMATTLLGAHKTAECPQCGYVSSFNASDQAEDGRVVREGVCQNCRQNLDLRGDKLRGGDRVIVGKFVYEGFTQPQRWDVVVFKCLESMRSNYVPKQFLPRERRNRGVMNYIKRLVGKPGETIRIDRGDIYVRPEDADEFEIARKPPHIMMAVRRLVFDNDYQPVDLERAPARWHSEGDGWTPAPDGRTFSGQAEALSWLRYRHLPDLRFSGPNARPQVITDFESYNDENDSPMNWVGDLMLDCQVAIDKLQGEVVFELVQGARQYRCVLDLDAGAIALTQNGRTIDEAQSPIRSTGDWRVRFANFDQRLTVWIGEELPFGEGTVVSPLSEDEIGPRVEDVDPVGIGLRGAAATVSNLQLYRDIYYTLGENRADAHTASLHADEEELDAWRRRLWNMPPRQFTLGPDDFFMLGDNSPRSLDGRSWKGTSFVDRRLLLGRALVLYLPAWRWMFVR